MYYVMNFLWGGGATQGGHAEKFENHVGNMAFHYTEKVITLNFFVTPPRTS